MNLSDLQRALDDFATERDWHRFHNPKNLAMALTNEVGELVEIFQWLTFDQAATIMEDAHHAEQVRSELADVLAYLLQLANILGVDMATALHDKMTVNARRFPIPLTQGQAAEYGQL